METPALAAIGAAALLASGAALVASAAENPASTVPEPTQGAQAQALAANRTHVADVQGTFSFTQDTRSTSEKIGAAFKRAAKTICGAAHLDQEPATPHVLSISGGSRGDVQASISELKQQEGVAGLTMACSCASNAPGGSLIVNADVSGVSVRDVAHAAGAL